MTRIIDTHCHLDFRQFHEDRDAVLERAQEHGVAGVVQIEIDPERWDLPADHGHKMVRQWRTAGVHPNSAAEIWNQRVHSQLRTALRTGRFIGVGETGIDLFRSKDSLESQVEAFGAHLDLASEFDLPVVIHQRAAEKIVLDVLRARGKVKGVMHCFGGDWNYAQACLDLGLYLGIGGVATYPSAQTTRDAIRDAPAERLLLETDAPYLAPQPVRGKRNEPSYLRFVVETIAACRGESEDDVRSATSQNAIDLFGLDLM